MALQVRSLLPQTWFTFFGRFGRLRPVQEMAIEPIVKGQDALVISPAATGKTEAVLAPITQRYLLDLQNEIRVLYIAPTKALVNDIHTRFSQQLKELGIRLDIKTGDHPTISEKKKPHILITTPESLDSMLGRKKKALKGVKAVILDEIHLLDRTYRGDQLIILLRRLRELVPEFQTVALSATVPDPEGIAQRYFLERPQIIVSPQKRMVDLYLVGTVDEAVEFLKKRGLYKAIWFCNSRMMVEKVAMHLKEGLWRKDRVFVHHASLPKSERIRVERAMHELQTGICVATMTLELGIDIGDVDAVVMLGAPPDTASFAQRVGRGCRRGDTMIAVGIAQNELDRDIFRMYSNYVNSGIMPEDDEYLPDISVVVQQVFSILFAKPSGVTMDYLAELLSPLTNKEDLEMIIAHLVKKEWLKYGPLNRIMATTRLMDVATKGKVHSNIPDYGTWNVIDIKSSTRIGEVDTVASKGQIVPVNGRLWMVMSVRPRKRELLVMQAGLEEEIKVLFKAKPGFGAFFDYLPPAIQERMNATQIEDFIDS